MRICRFKSNLTLQGMSELSVVTSRQGVSQQCMALSGYKDSVCHMIISDPPELAL